jgi:hypothetical protein
MSDHLFVKVFRIVQASVVLLALCACNQQQEQTALAVLQGGLNALDQNRSLSEEFVREVKDSGDPGSPSYLQAQASYDDARDRYNAYLDTIEAGKVPKQSKSRSLDSRRALEASVTDSVATFLGDATSALKPSVNTRRVPFERGVTLPSEIPDLLTKLSRRDREQLVAQFDKQVRWRSWSQL